MKEVNDAKASLAILFEGLSEEKKKEIKEYFEIYGSHGLEKMAKELAERAIYWADRKDYGYGEMRYMFREAEEEMKEDGFPEIAKAYKRLSYAYFDMLVEIKEA